MAKMAKKLTNNLHRSAFYKIMKFVLIKKVYQYFTKIYLTAYMGDFFCKTVVLTLAKKVTNNSPKFPQQKFGQN